MDVYIEYVIIDNLIIDYLLLTNTYRILRIKTIKAWIFFCAILGTIFAIVLPIINLKNVYKTIIKLIFSFMLVFISARFICQRCNGRRFDPWVGKIP